MNLRLADLLFRDLPASIHPAAQRTDAALPEPVELGQHVMAVRTGEAVGRDVELLGHVLDQLVPRGQADAHRRPGADEEDGAMLLDRARQCGKLGLHRSARRFIRAARHGRLGNARRAGEVAAPERRPGAKQAGRAT